MQEKEQNISPIKQRILHYVDYLEISKREFYAKTGISRGTLESSTGITEETLAKLFANYEKLNPTWVLLGTGEMELIDVKEGKKEDSEKPQNITCKNCEILHRYIETLEAKIAEYEGREKNYGKAG